MEVAPQRTQKWTESYFRKRLVVLSNKKSNIVLELQDFLDSGLQNVGHFLDSANLYRQFDKYCDLFTFIVFSFFTSYLNGSLKCIFLFFHI